MAEFDQVNNKDKANESFCGLCKKQLSSKSNFIKHRNAVHLKLKLYQCKICDKSYTDSTPLRYHMELHKLDFESTKDKSFQCSDCDKAFLLKRYLYHHKINAHTDKRIRSCKLCSVKYKSDGHLRKH